MARGKVQQEFCPLCEHNHPVALFREVAGVGKICIFCAEKHEREVEKRQVEKTKHDDRFKLAMAESAALDRIREQREAEDRRKRERRIRKERALKKAQKQEISAEDTSAIAQEELARRELARRHLLPFVERFNDRYEAGWVHKDICARLEKFSLDVAERKSPRLMLYLPPRHGKSEIVSRNFPAWHLGKYPEHEFIACSYASDLALGFSRKVREIIRSPEYAQLFPDTELARDSQRADQWNTTAAGGYAAAGVGGPITGKGSHILIIDDPVKNREEADSESIRQSIWDWYTSTAYTRLAPGGGVLVVQTRWHDDDLSGRLLMQMAKGEGDDWEVVEYPAIAIEDERYRRKGEALHPARYPLDALQRIKRAIGDRDWSALYQQKPVADDGDFFTRDMFPRYRMAEQPAYDDMSYYTAWDLAIGQSEQNDETFGITVGVDRNKRIWVVDVRHGRWDSEGIVNQILDTYAVWRSDITGIERGHIEMAIGPYLEQEIQRKGLKTMYIQQLKPGRRDKQSRARSIQALMKRNEVMFRSGCEATQYLIDQMLRFPSGVHDDGVDAIAYIGLLVGEMTSVSMPKPKKRNSWRQRLMQSALGRRGSSSHMGA
jgi:predicted phage terminase large subunit-like protein